MTESAPHLSDVTQTPPGAETFWHVLLRRSRYIVAIAVSVFIFWNVGWSFIAPPADGAGATVLGWLNHADIVSTLMLALLLLGASVVSMLIIHPDTPHTGFFCALLGMSSLAIRGGTSHLLVQSAQLRGQYGSVSLLLALECIQLGIVILIVEIIVREIHRRFLSNTRWMMRTGAHAGLQKLEQLPSGGLGMNVSVGVSLAIRKGLRTNNLSHYVTTPLAILVSSALSFLFLYEFLQTQKTGQVFFASIASFFVATLLAYFAFPRVHVLAYMLVVPLTGAFGYWYGRADAGTFPGEGGFFMSRALPMFLITAGVPGVILGYYWGFEWSLRTEEGEE